MWFKVKQLGVPLCAALILATGPAMAAERYEIDTVHSAIGFKVRHLFSHTTGCFTVFSGVLHYDAEHPEQSSIALVIQASSIDTDNERRDDHLRSADFFDVAQHPTLAFQSTKIESAGERDLYHVTGDFTLRGVTRPVTVVVEILGFGEIPGMGTRGGFSAQTTINRQDFGVKWNKVLDKGAAVLGDEVHIDCSLEVMKP